jgi:kynurenine formamidase
MFKKIIDLSHELTSGMPVHPFDNSPVVRKTKEFTQDHYTDHELITGMHVGTHIDGPLHMLETGKNISELPLDYCVGRGVLIDARNKFLDRTLLDTLNTNNIRISHETIVLILTGHDKTWGTRNYFNSYPVMGKDFAQGLVDMGVHMIGLDTPSPDPMRFPFANHKSLLSHNVFIIENLTKLELLVGVKNFIIVALPLKITTDSSPARVIACVRE